METIADLRKLIDLLAKRGYSESDVEGMMHGNWIRRLNDIWS
jgi:membrane dipeptidase